MKRVIVTMLLICGLTAANAQGMYWQSTSEGMGGKHNEENFAAPKMFKMVRTGGAEEGSVMIVRLDKKLMWMLNPEKKTYSEITFADIQKMANKGSDKMAAMKEKMKGMPEEQRKMMEKMMGGQMDQPVTVKKTGETKSILGHSCTKLIVMRGEEEFMTLWISKDVKGFAPLMADWKEFSEQMASMTSRFAKGMSDVYKEIKGFPLETSVSMMGHSMTTVVTKVEMRSTPASEFDIPLGYTKVKSPMEEEMQKMDKEE
jgi:hypothetical protein